MDDSMSSRIASIYFSHHLGRIGVSQHDLIKNLDLLPGSLGDDGSHGINIEVHSYQHRSIGQEL